MLKHVQKECRVQLREVKEQNRRKLTEVWDVMKNMTGYSKVLGNHQGRVNQLNNLLKSRPRWSVPRTAEGLYIGAGRPSTVHL